MLSSRTSTTRLLLEAFSLLLAVVIGWAPFRLKALGYSVGFACIGPLSISGIRYHSKTTSISIASIHFAFHIPRPSNPRWGTLTVIGYEHKSPTCHFSVSSLQTTLWFFPLLFRVSSGPWMVTEVDEFRLRVFNSVDTPGWVQRLRVNLVGAILKGEILRCDEFTTRLSLSSITGVAEGRSSSAPVEKPGVERPDLEDEIRITTDAKAYETKNWLDRIYSFGRMQAQLRKSWVDGRGSFVLVCEDVAWTKIQSPTAIQSRATNFWWYVYPNMRRPYFCVLMDLKAVSMLCYDAALRPSKVLLRPVAALRSSHQSS